MKRWNKSFYLEKISNKDAQLDDYCRMCGMKSVLDGKPFNIEKPTNI